MQHWYENTRAQRDTDKTEAPAEPNCSVMDYLTWWKPFFKLRKKEKAIKKAKKASLDIFNHAESNGEYCEGDGKTVVFAQHIG